MEIREIPGGVAALCARLRSAGREAYPVGGCVRDLLLGRTPGDWDVTTSARPEEVMALFERTVPTGIKHGTVTVLTGAGGVEVTTFRAEGGYADGRHPDAVTFGGDLAGDLSRRDFTINAMALGPDGAVIDPFGGRADLKAGLIRCVGEPERRFVEDALRMLRAVRFSAQLDFAIEGATAEALRKNAGLNGEVSFDEPLNTDWDGNELLLSDVLGTDADVVMRPIEEDVERDLLAAAISVLSPREKQIITLRFGLGGGKEQTQKEVADQLGISQSYISRLEKRILSRLHVDLARVSS